MQPLANVQLDKHGKPKKVKREKVRFGQAPREALPEESGDTTTATGTREPSASGQDARRRATPSELIQQDAQIILRRNILHRRVTEGTEPFL